MEHPASAIRVWGIDAVQEQGVEAQAYRGEGSLPEIPGRQPPGFARGDAVRAGRLGGSAPGRTLARRVDPTRASTVAASMVILRIEFFPGRPLARPTPFRNADSVRSRSRATLAIGWGASGTGRTAPASKSSVDRLPSGRNRLRPSLLPKITRLLQPSVILSPGRVFTPTKTRLES